MLTSKYNLIRDNNFIKKHSFSIITAYVEEIITCPATGVLISYKIYAHSDLDRLLITELHVKRGLAEGDISVIRESDLGGDKDDLDFFWQAEIERQPGKWLVEKKCYFIQ